MVGSGRDPGHITETSAKVATVSEPGGSFPQWNRSASVELFQKAIVCHQAGRLAEAEQFYQAVLKDDGRHFAAVHGLGLIRLQLGRHADAEPLFRRAIKINGKSAEAHHHLAVSLTGLGLPQEAGPV